MAQDESQVAYINDDLGVHRMWNNGVDYADFLSLYTPPNIVKHECFVFDEVTRERTHVTTSNISLFGLNEESLARCQLRNILSQE
jgi:hypothetical protein